MGVVSLKDVPSSMLPTLTLVVLHGNNSTRRTLTRISSSFSKDNNNNNNNLASLIPNLPKTNSLPKTHNSLPLDNSNNLPPSNNSSLPLSHNSLLLHHSP